MKQLDEHKMNYIFIVQNDCVKLLNVFVFASRAGISLHEGDDIGVTLTFTWHTDRKKLKFDHRCFP
jgi:hypothetical protein